MLSVMLEIFLSKREILQLYMNRVYLGGGIYGVEAMSRRTFRQAGVESDAGRGRAAGRRHSRAGVVLSLESTRARARRAASSCCGACARRGRSRPLRSRRRGASGCACGRHRPSSNGRHGYAKEFLRQQFRDLVGDDNPPDWKVQHDVRAGSPGCRGDRRAQRSASSRRAGPAGRAGRDRSRAPATCWRSSAVRTFRRRPSTARHAVVASRGPRSSRSCMPPLSSSGLSPVSTLSGLQQVAVQAPEGVWIPRDDRAKTHDTMTLREALLESSNAAAVLLQQRVGARPVIQAGHGSRCPESAERAVARARQRAGDPARSDGRVCRLSGHGLPRPAARPGLGRGRGRRRSRARAHRARAGAVRAGRVPDGLDASGRRAAGHRVRACSARGFRWKSAGKTGTTNDSHDAWFVGFSSSVVAGVWIGFDEPQTIRSDASGSRMALPIWADFMRRTARRLPAEPFAQPVRPALRADVLAVVSPRARRMPELRRVLQRGDDVPSQLCELHSGSLKQRAERALRGLLGAIGEEIRGIFR